MKDRIFGLPISIRANTQEEPRLIGEIEGSELLTREFRLPREVRERLNPIQRKILDRLTRVARRTADLFALQISEGERASFYPPKVSKSEIFSAAIDNPEILSPYTILDRDSDGKLIARNMHEVYAHVIKELNITGLLREAASVAGKGRDRDISLQAYLRAKARSLETGDYEASERIWLERPDEPVIDIVVGPHDTYTDGFLGIKYAWESWVGVLDEQATADSQWFLDSFLSWWQERTGMDPPKVKMRIDYTRILAGQAALYDWVGNSLPCQHEWRQKYGSKFTIFGKKFNDKFQREKRPAFRMLIDPSRRMGVPDSVIKTVSLQRHIAHETAHSLGVASDLEPRLQQYADTIKELYCDLLGLVGYFGIKGISLRERELAFATAFAEGKIDYNKFKNDGSRPHYYAASSTLLTYMVSKGSVEVDEGILTWEDPREVFNDIEALFNFVNNLQTHGQIRDVEKFLSEFFDPEVYGRLKQLKKFEIPNFLRNLNLAGLN